MMKVIIGVGITIVLIVIIYYLANPPKSYSLFVCSLVDGSQCDGNAYELHDIDTLEKCLSRGREYLDAYPGFECGLNCRYDRDWGAQICEKIYDSRGKET